MKVGLPSDLRDFERDIMLTALAARGHAVADEAGEAEALIVGGEPLTAANLARSPRLSRVVRFARGRWDVGQEEALCRARGIGYRRISGTSAKATAEHAVLLMLTLLRRLDRSLSFPAQEAWPQVEIMDAGLRELRGRRVGLIGLGATGQATASLLEGFGAHCLYHAPRRLSRDQERRLGVEYADLDTLLDRSDIVSLHVRSRAGEDPLILDRRRLDRLRSDAIVVNTGDGRSVDLEALFAKAARGELTAGLDVFPEEPWSGPSPPGVILTPHIAGRTRDVARRLFEDAVAALDPPAAAPGDGGPSETPLATGALAAHLAAAPLAGGSARVLLGGEPRLAVLADLLARLGCAEATVLASEPPARVEIDGQPPTLLRLELEPASDSQGPTTASLPALGWLASRWRLDQAVWDQLLPGDGAPSLPGRRLTVRGYDPGGRSVAWRARELGARVAVWDEDPIRQLDAIHDGFERADPADGAEGIDVGRIPLPPLTGLAAPLIDALMAASLLLLCGPADEADRTLADLLLQDRSQP
jgi:phosphoglycerate dehydrogenase-like enzyme